MGYKILLVDDEATIRRLMVMLLKRGGHQVIEAASGQEAINLAPRERPDLILLDIMMPAMDGFETLSRLRTMPNVAETPVIFLSAKAEVTDRVEGLRLGADDYLVKPADPEELLARIDAVMMRTRRQYRRPRGNVFGFVGCKGGVGTTTAMINLAASLQQNNQSTLLLDLHLAFGHLADYLGMAPTQHTTADLALMPADEIDEAAIRRVVASHASGMKVLAAPMDVPVGVTFSAEHLGNLVKEAAYEAQVTLIDLPVDADIIEAVADHLDGVIIVVGAEPSSLRAAMHLVEHLGRLGLHNRLSALQVNRIPAEFQYVTGSLVNDKLGCLFLGSIGYKPDIYLRAEYNQTPLLLASKSGSEPALYEEICTKLLNYTDILDQFHKRQHLESRHLS
jgi:DNA-binding response OmpR family regulator